MSRHLEQLGLSVNIQRVNGDARTEAVFRTLLDADVVINGTDTHGSRAIINELANTYLLPVRESRTITYNRHESTFGRLLARAKVDFTFTHLFTFISN